MRKKRITGSAFLIKKLLFKNSFGFSFIKNKNFLINVSEIKLKNSLDFEFCKYFKKKHLLNIKKKKTFKY